MHTFPKRYDHSKERDVYQRWIDNNLFSPEGSTKQFVAQGGTLTQKKYAISMPPPNVTGVLHIGHALMLAVQDTMVRYARMHGDETVYIPGTDHAGISTQVVVEKQLQKQGIDHHALTREQFLEKIREWVGFSRPTIIDQMKRMGVSADWSREEFTVSERLSRAVRKVFAQLYNNDKIYKDAYIINWSVGAQSVVSDLEVVHKEEKGKLYKINYFVNGKGYFVQVATTRPETIFADVAIAVHPKDSRYKKRIGRSVLIPIINKEIPIIADERVDMHFGTGALKITPAHDPNDFAIAADHNLPMDQYAIDKQGRFTELAGDYAGLEVYEGLKNIITHLREIGNLEGEEEHIHTVPYCDRTDTRIQPMISTQRFMDVEEAGKQAHDRINKKEIIVHPERFEKTFHQRLGELKPRCISRQLVRGHRIPVREDPEGKRYVFTEEDILNDNQYSNKILSMIIFNLIADSRLTHAFSIDTLLNVLTSESLNRDNEKVYEAFLRMYESTFGQESERRKEMVDIKYTCKDREKTKLARLLQDAGCCHVDETQTYATFIFPHNSGPNLTQETDTLDTWFSAGLRPFSILGRPDKTQDLQKYYPTTVIETGYDIIFFRVARMMIMGHEAMNEIPFEQVYLHGLVRDKHGRKMSKSIGNIVDPLDIIEKYGADALRLSLLRSTAPGNDENYDDEKTKYATRFITKLWNATRYVTMNYEIPDTISYPAIVDNLRKNADNLTRIDQRIIYKCNDLIGDIEHYHSKFMIGERTQIAIDFVRHQFCDRYLEMAKVYDSEYSVNVMLYVMGTILHVLHPVMPFVTEKIRKQVGFAGFLCTSQYPIPIQGVDKQYYINLLIHIVSKGRALRAMHNIREKDIPVLIVGNRDFVSVVADHEKLLQKLLVSSNIHIDETIPEDVETYVTEIVEDATIGLRNDSQASKKEELQRLKQMRDKEAGFLNSIRSLLMNPGFKAGATAEVIAEKTKKMQEVKQTIATIDEQIAKIKM